MIEIKLLRTEDSEEIARIMKDVYGLEKHKFFLKDSAETPVVSVMAEADVSTHIMLDIPDDRMSAYLSLYPPMNDGKLMELDDIIEYVTTEHALSEDMLKKRRIREAVRLLHEGYIVEHLLISEGYSAIDGKDGGAELLFEPPSRKPKIDEHGNSDFREIHRIVQVEKDQPLIQIIPASPGLDGRRVNGEVISATRGVNKEFKIISGVYYDRADKQYKAEIDGHVILQPGAVAVYPVYVVAEDVDYSVGNIDFNGTVIVKGDVLPGFEIQAKNIIIEGVLQNASVRAKEDITVKTGIVANLDNPAEAGANIIAGFCENAFLKAGGSIEINQFAMHSKLYAERDIYATSQEGLINGGEVRAFGHVKAVQLGKAGGPSFKVQVGVKYYLEERVQKMMQEKDRLKNKIEETDRKLKSQAVMVQDKRNADKVKQIITARKHLVKKHEAIDEKIEKFIDNSMHARPTVEVSGKIYDGVILKFFGTEHIADTQEGRKFYFDTFYQSVKSVKASEEIEIEEGHQEAPEEEYSYDDTSFYNPSEDFDNI